MPALLTSEYGDAARRLCLGDLRHDDVFIGDHLESVLTAIQQWLSRGGNDPLDQVVLDPLSRWELRRKGSRRAKLPRSAHGREAQAVWRADETTLAVPIGYRWSLVRRLLQDLLPE